MHGLWEGVLMGGEGSGGGRECLGEYIKESNRKRGKGARYKSRKGIAKKGKKRSR